MFRRNSCGIVAICAASALGCGGTVDDSFKGHPHAGKLADFGGKAITPVYFNVTSTVRGGAGPMLAGFELVAGARVELETATADSSPLRFELRRVRKDGTTEMLEPVDVGSGFHLTTFEATSDGQFVEWFPNGATTDVVVSIKCLSGEGRCSPFRQPNESCAPGFACDTGLDCALPEGACDAWTAMGTCVARPLSCAESAVSVCGCDGRSYASACMARGAGASVSHAGECDQASTIAR